MKEYELIHEVGSIVKVPAEIKSIYGDGGVFLRVGKCLFVVPAEQALDLGLIKKVARKPQVGDVYKDSHGVMFEIKAIDDVHVWYIWTPPTNIANALGGKIEEIEDWGELV
tara:strand:- start:937 stop:1269 length:333 start_codon:yes stop_codon:yes gene_type:complete